jgi:hypothetical protein
VKETKPFGLPFFSQMECEQLCLRNCSCSAFASLGFERNGVGCLTWYGKLMEITEFEDGREMYVRVDAIELGILVLALPCYQS